MEKIENNIDQILMYGRVVLCVLSIMLVVVTLHYH